MSINSTNNLLKRYVSTDCRVIILQRKAGQWNAFLSKKPDQFVKNFLNRLFGKIQISY